MTADLRPYLEYKDSGLPWLGRVPAHWDVRRAKFLLRCIDVRSTTGEEELLTVSAERGVVPRNSMKVTMFKAESYVGHKLCWPGDLAINSLWAWGRGLGVTKHHGIISSAYGVYRLRERFKQYGDFIHHLVRSTPFHWELRVRSKGVWISRLQLTDDAFLDAPIPLPSPPEAEAIVRFIATMERRISRFIRNRRRLIEVLNEQKQAIINRAVTRGLDPNVRLKPSGIDWLGDIPEHWEVKPLKRLAWFKSGAGFPVTSQGRERLEVPFFRVSDMTRAGNEVFMNIESSTVTHDDARALGATVFPAGTIIFPKVGGALLTNKRRILAKPSCIDNNLMGCVVNQAARDFVFLLLRVIDFGQMCKPGPVPAIGEGDVREIRVPVPPRDEQQQIVLKERSETVALDEAMKTAQREIDLIREYRTRLIADVVTGKVDVRHMALEAVEPPAEDVEPLDDSENVTEDEMQEVDEAESVGDSSDD